MGQIHIGEVSVRESDIAEVDISEIESLIVRVRLVNRRYFFLDGQPALDFIMRVCPQVIEGKRLRWARHAWAFHNLVAHPLLQVFHWFGFTGFGMMIHDSTIPRPKGVK
jgi:hypothetical protein